MYTETLDDLDELYALETDDENLSDVQPFGGLTVKEAEEEDSWMTF